MTVFIYKTNITISVDFTDQPGVRKHSSKVRPWRCLINNRGSVLKCRNDRRTCWGAEKCMRTIKACVLEVAYLESGSRTGWLVILSAGQVGTRRRNGGAIAGHDCCRARNCLL